MTLATILHAAPSTMWAFVLGALVVSHRDDRRARRRLTATILASIWLTFCAASLWQNPAIEPLWLQYLLLIALPAVVGAGVAWIVGRVRASRSTAPREDRSISEGTR